MSTARLIVCESRGAWAVALRRALRGGGPRVYETRGFDDCWEMLGEHSDSFLLLELTPRNMSAGCRMLVELRHTFPRAATAVALADAESEWRLPLREAGAEHVISSPRAAPALARMARGHLNRAPRPDESFADALRRRMPWASAGER